MRKHPFSANRTRKGVMIKPYFSVMKQYPAIIGLGFLAMLFSNFGQTFFIGLYNEDFRAAFSLSNTEFGIIYSGVTVLSAILLLCLGHFVDKVSLHHYITAICLSLATGCLLISGAENLPLFVLGLGMVRFLGQGVMTHFSSTVVARYVHVGRGKGLSLASLGIPLGSAFLPLLSTILVAAIGWRESWLVYTALYAFAALPLMLKLAPDRNVSLPDELEDTLHPSHTVRHALHEPLFWAVIVAGMLMPFLMTGIFFHQRFIMDSLGFSQALYASMFVLFGATGVAANFVAGWLVDHVGPGQVLKWFLLPFLLALLLVMNWPHPATLAAWMVALAISAGCFHPAQGSFLAERYGVRRLGSLKSILTSSIVLSSAIAPGLFGYIIDKTGESRILFTLCWSSTLAVMVFVFWQLRRHGKPTNRPLR